ncbi:sensor histidine kinase [Paenibacillus xylanilyticus]|uniref:sensor histidine kinase n=1 Tax=Paenibacillus xylanilyticus TaxID=248903 RepID=UPI00129E7A6D|nr:sensor histidine kinase [Paenibacillus xylanilyticus]
MKLFMREHLALTCWVVVILITVVGVFWYDGYDHMLTAVYAVSLGLFLYTGYLTYRYMSHRAFYTRMTQPMNSLNEFVPLEEMVPLSVALEKLLDSQYGHYHAHLHRLEQRQQEYLTFMNQWVHQMKTPLSVIELTVQDEEDDDPRLRSIREEADQMRRGLETVLYVARLDTFEQDFSVEPVTLKAAGEEAIHELKRFFIRNHVYPEIQMDASLIVQSDAKWIRFVIVQLLSNAIKYSSGNGQKIYLRAYKADRSIILEVQDQGAGIPKSDLNRVFQPFFTGENGRHFKESTGMGLYIVKEVLTRMNHRIDLESVYGEGTTVRITFSV